jgi:hypothetical protein
VFPVHAADGSCHPISIRGKNIVATRATVDLFLSVTDIAVTRPSRCVFFSGNAPHDEFANAPHDEFVV